MDSALRLIAFYWHARGQPQRRHVLSLTGGYHGSSTAGAGVTALAAFHRGVDFSAGTRHRLTNPSPYRHPEATPAAIIAASVAELRALVARLGPDQVAAVFCEPIQGSGGVLVPPDGWMAAMRERCRELDILFVADEVITGFGRTGPMFACEHEGVSPDLMTMAKGLTSGYAPMGAVMLSETVYDAIADAGDGTVPLGHGLTYSGHPVSAAVALEVIRLYTEEGLLENGQRMGALLQPGCTSASTTTRWSATCAGAACWRRSNWWATSAPKAKLPAALGVGDRLAALGTGTGLIFRAFARRHDRAGAAAVLHGGRHRAAGGPPGRHAVRADAGNRSAPRPGGLTRTKDTPREHTTFRDRPADTQEVRLTDFDVLAFDCYGTLIDWEGGIHTALQPLLARLPAAAGPRRRAGALRPRGVGAAGRDARR